VHGGVRDVQQYMTTKALIAQNAARLRARTSWHPRRFFGHCHEQRVRGRWRHGDGLALEKAFP
jgi:hypothetical protein